MPRLKCPRCSNVVEVPQGSKPVCPHCGFGSTSAPSAPPAARPPAPAAPSAPASPPPAMSGWAASAGSAPGLTPLSPPSMARQAAPGGPGPVGKVREPWVVLVLTLVTFGIYSLAWWWMISAEVDRHIQKRHAHPMIRLAVFLIVGTLLLYVVALIVLLGGLAAAASSGNAGGFAAAGIVGVLLLLVVIAAAIAALVLQIIGFWRVWSVVHDRDVATGSPKPLSPGLMMAFWLIPYLNIVTLWIAMYKTQSHLNAMWEGRVAQ